MSPSLKRLIRTFSWKDSFRTLFPKSKSFSRYYDNERFGEGATRIDRIYQFGDMIAKEAQYVGLPFSDHFGLIVKFSLPPDFGKLTSPKTRSLFKVKPEVVRDSVFKTKLKEQFAIWTEVKINLHLDTLFWWETIVKPGIKKLLI